MVNDSWADFYTLCYRIYAVTMKKISIAALFAVITASQLGLGICLVTVAVKGKSKVKLQTRKNYISLRASTRFAAVAHV